MFSFFFPQDRRDLVSSHGSLGQLGTSVSTSASSFSAAPRLSHTPTTDFQPPYFPPPYNLPPQQPADVFHHHQVNADPYSHINSFQHGPHQYHPLQTPDRSAAVLRHRDDPLNVHGFGAYDSRRSDYPGTVRRPDVLLHGGHHGLGEQESNLLAIHGNVGLMDHDGTQVSQQ